MLQGLVWWLNSVRASFPEILLLLGLKLAATATAINSSLKAGKRRNIRDSCTHSFDKHVSSGHNLPDAVTGTGVWLSTRLAKSLSSGVHLSGRRQ